MNYIMTTTETISDRIKNVLDLNGNSQLNLMIFDGSLSNKKLEKFRNVIQSLGNGKGSKLEYKKSGSSGHTFKGIVRMPDDSREYNYGVKIVAYSRKSYGDPSTKSRPENAELLMLKLLSQFVIHGRSPHIVLPVIMFDTNLKPLINLHKGKKVINNRYEKFVDKFKNGEYYSIGSVLISEWASHGDFLDYLKKQYRTIKLIEWKTFMFQLISVLAVIQLEYPTFRHNDLKANNVLIHQIASKPGEYYLYNINNQKYAIPNIGFHLKIWDFDFACIPGIVENAKVNAEWTQKINVNPEKNRYYDIHYFFNTLIKKGFLPNILKSSHVPKEMKEFINRVVPPQYQKGEYIAKGGRIIINHEYTTPLQLIEEDEFFEDFRKNRNLIG